MLYFHATIWPRKDQKYMLQPSQGWEWDVDQTLSNSQATRQVEKFES